MPCPIHIWVPLMAAAAPVARVARGRIRDVLEARRAPREPEAPREIKRWAPVGGPQNDQTEPAARPTS